MLRFDDLKFVDDLDGLPFARARVNYELYELSVVKGTAKTLYEAAILTNKGWARLPGINEHDDVVPYLSPKKVTAIMVKLSSLTMHPGEIL